MYFRELQENYSTRWWYLVGRSLLTLLMGLLLILVPDAALDWFIPVVGIALIVDGGIIALPMLLGKTTRHLWKIVLLRESLQMVTGSFLIFNQTFGFDLFAVLLGVFLLLRGVLELILFVEVHTRVWHRRWLLLTTLMFLALGVIVLVNAFTKSVFVVDLAGIYLIFEGITHALTAHRQQTTIQDVQCYERSILAGSVENQSADEIQPVKPQPPQERSFLLPHLDTRKYRKIMVLTPHPDDLEGFVGGLAYRLSGKVVSVIFAGGDKGRWSKTDQILDKGDYIRVRLAESAQAARLLGVREIVYMGYLDRTVAVDETAIDKTLALFRLHQPDLVVSFEFFKRATPYPHPDHLATANIVRQAVARYEQAAQLDYVVVSTLLPNCFVDVTGVRRIKLEALACHSTQTDLNALIFPFFEKLLSRLWGVFSGVDYAEGYRQIDVQSLQRQLKVSHD
jgi:LmbE family N-acetylglucosaminyl deacetylase/uncharacterized membrane protein HdeD (DUF308 family)